MGIEAASYDAVAKLQGELEAKEKRLYVLQSSLHEHSAKSRQRAAAEGGVRGDKEPLVAVKFSLLANPQKEWSEHTMVLGHNYIGHNYIGHNYICDRM